MKNKIIAISLLLSFLLILVHVMIPHHHHEGIAVEYSTTCERECETEYSDCSQEEHEDRTCNSQHWHTTHDCDNDGTQEHFHDYTHSHAITECNALAIAQRGPNSELSRLHRLFLPFIITAFLDTHPPEQSNNKNILYTEFHPLISSPFVPEANALRGPPFCV